MVASTRFLIETIKLGRTEGDSLSDIDPTVLLAMMCPGTGGETSNNFVVGVHTLFY